MLKQIREFFWPILEEGKESTPLYKKKENVIKKSNLDIALKLALQMYQDERERVQRIETKAMCFIAFFGALMSFVLFVIKDVVMGPRITFGNIFLVIWAVVVSIYSTRVMIFAVKTLERVPTRVISEDVFYGKTCGTQDIIQKIILIVRRNYATINRKVDNMAMTHLYANRVIVSMCLGILLYCAGYLWRIFLPFFYLLFQIYDFFTINNHILKIYFLV